MNLVKRLFLITTFLTATPSTFPQGVIINIKMPSQCTLTNVSLAAGASLVAGVGFFYAYKKINSELGKGAELQNDIHTLKAVQENISNIISLGQNESGALGIVVNEHATILESYTQHSSVTSIEMNPSNLKATQDSVREQIRLLIQANIAIKEQTLEKLQSSIAYRVALFSRNLVSFSSSGGVDESK